MGQDRADLHQRLDALGFRLRPEATVIPIGQTLALAGTAVLVEAAVADAGMVLVLWCASGDGARGVGLATFPRVAEGHGPDGVGWGLLTHRGEPELALEFARPDGRTLHRAGLRVPLPAWDGGRSLPPASVLGSPLAIGGFAAGGLGGRLDLTIGPRGPGDGTWTLAGPPPPLPLPMEPPPPARRAPPGPAEALSITASGGPPADAASLHLRCGPTLAPARQATARWDAAAGVQELGFAFAGPLPAAPIGLLLSDVQSWRAIPPVGFTLSPADIGHRFAAPLGPGLPHLEVQAGALVEGRGGARALAWSTRSRGAPSQTPALVWRLPSGRWDRIWEFGVRAEALPCVAGWSHHRTPLGDRATVEAACIGLGTLEGPLELPLPPEGPDAPEGPADPVAASALVGLLSPPPDPECATRVAAAAAAAARRGASDVTPEHLLLALLRGPGRPEPLDRLSDGDVAVLVVALERVLFPRRGPVAGFPRPAPALQQALAGAAAAALGRGATATASRDLVAGLARGADTAAARLLRAAGAAFA